MKSNSLIFYFLIIILFIGCQEKASVAPQVTEVEENKEGVEIIVLGTAQDAGAPHIGCKKSCCERIRTESNIHRSAEEIPHPLVEESMDLFKNESIEIRNKAHVIHINHTNPLLNVDSEGATYFIDRDFQIARLGEVFKL